MRIARITLSIAIVGLMGEQALAASGEQIGSALTVINHVTAAYASEQRTLKSGDGVRQNELIEVAPTAKSEIQLNDNTKLALGPGSRLLLDRFVYDPGKTGNAIVLNMIKGTFRFITGSAQKPAYVIRTPSAAITVRGTIFDTYVMASGEAWVMLQEGGINVCNGRGSCRSLDEPGKMIPITSDGEIGTPVRWADLGPIDGSIFDRAFPFVRETPGIDPNPVFTREALLKPTSYTPVLKKTFKRVTNVESYDQGSRLTPRRAPKFLTVVSPKKRPVMKAAEKDDDDYDVVKPRKPVRVWLPGRVKIKKPKYDEEAESHEPKGEKGRKFLRTALDAAVLVGSFPRRTSNHPTYPKNSDMGQRRSSLGSILK